MVLIVGPSLLHGRQQVINPDRPPILSGDWQSHRRLVAAENGPDTSDQSTIDGVYAVCSEVLDDFQQGSGENLYLHIWQKGAASLEIAHVSFGCYEGVMHLSHDPASLPHGPLAQPPQQVKPSQQ